MEFCKFVLGNSRIKNKLNIVITVKKRGRTPCLPYEEEIFGFMVSFLYSIEKVL